MGGYDLGGFVRGGVLTSYPPAHNDTEYRSLHALMPMKHVPETGAENPYQKSGTTNRQENRACNHSLPETDTRQIRYQVAYQTRQKLVPVLSPISGKCAMGITSYIPKTLALFATGRYSSAQYKNINRSWSGRRPDRAPRGGPDGRVQSNQRTRRANELQRLLP